MNTKGENIVCSDCGHVAVCSCIKCKKPYCEECFKGHVCQETL